MFISNVSKPELRHCIFNYVTSDSDSSWSSSTASVSSGLLGLLVTAEDWDRDMAGFEPATSKLPPTTALLLLECLSGGRVLLASPAVLLVSPLAS